jgi:molybdate transport system substrate-binding protein
MASFIMVCLVALVAQAACAQNLTVFAAASLKESLDAVAIQHLRMNGIRVQPSYFASSALAKQIESGAPADIFISADIEWMDYLEERKLLKTGTRSNLLHNRLVLIVPADSKLQIDIKPGMPLSEALRDGKLSMADPDSVPAGKYGRAALEKLGVWKGVERSVVRGDNVRTALNFVARGEAPLGIVYQTDAYAEKRVRIAGLFPQDTHPAITYPVAVVASSRHAGAQAFVNYLKSAEARAIFEKYGFTVER